jgi:branched-chain amino acid transport system substrate-binding protein
LIYLNNAIVNLNPNRPPRRIAVSVPIGSNVNVASEMLRGIAQAQNEINNKDGAKLEIKIANDSNNEQIARSIAAEFVNDDKILAVVGHNASNVSKAAADIYQNRGLVMITPASFADILSGFSPIFRTVPNPQLMAYRLAKYVINTAKKTNIAVCYDSEATDNNSFKESFVESLKKLGGEISRWRAILLCQRLMRML